MRANHGLWPQAALLLACACAGAAEDQHAQSFDASSPYVDQVNSPIRGLSVREIDDLTNGRGMGFARAAELNSYPGPRHVLELRQPLALTSELAQQVEQIAQRMNQEARQLGQEILTQEQALDQLFREGSITPAELAARCDGLGQLYARLRAVHLGAHLETRALLSPEQVRGYDQLRGYASGMQHDHPS